MSRRTVVNVSARVILLVKCVESFILRKDWLSLILDGLTDYSYVSGFFTLCI